MQGTRVEHRAEDAEDFQIRVEAILNLLDGVGEQSDTTQGEELTFQRHDDVVRSRQSVDGEQTQRRSAGDEDHVVLATDTIDDPLEGLLTSHFADELHLRRRKVDVGR